MHPLVMDVICKVKERWLLADAECKPLSCRHLNIQSNYGYLVTSFLIAGNAINTTLLLKNIGLFVEVVGSLD
jgi:hypothetical protein